MRGSRGRRHRSDIEQKISFGGQEPHRKRRTKRKLSDIGCIFEVQWHKETLHFTFWDLNLNSGVTFKKLFHGVKIVSIMRKDEPWRNQYVILETTLKHFLAIIFVSSVFVKSIALYISFV